MAKRYDLLKIQFDSSINLDDGYSFDVDKAGVADIESSTSLDPSKLRYEAINVVDFTITARCSVLIAAAKAVDLLPLVPEKFRGSEVVSTFLYEIGVMVGHFLTLIDDVPKLVDPYVVGETYLRELAALIKVSFYIDDDTTLEDLRRQLVFAVEWYKMKGAYPSLEYLSTLTGFTLAFKEMYTEDYSTFMEAEWYVALTPGANPTGISDASYKSPHFGVIHYLDKYYGSLSDAYLYKDSMHDRVVDYVEKTRPINTVPHYILSLKPITQSDEQVQITTALIKTRLTTTWSPDRKYFDGSGSEEGIFDDGEFFDQSSSAFLNSITHWKIGAGNKNGDLTDSAFAFEDIRQTGTVDKMTQYVDRVEFQCTVAKATVETDEAGYSEFGLYLNDEVTMVGASLFPDIFKGDDEELRITFVVYWS